MDLDKCLEYLKLYQYTYKIGAPLLNDTEYDAYVRELSQYVEVPRRWDYISDEEGLSLMSKYGLLASGTTQERVFDETLYVREVPAPTDIVEEYNHFKKDPNRSIPIVTDTDLFTKVYETFKEFGTDKIFASLKLDGWNISLYVKNGSIVYAHTRGKLAEVKDVTSIMKEVLRDIDGKMNIERGYVIGELYLNSDSLPYLRDKYNKQFKTTRNSVSTFINNKVIAEDMPIAKFGAFKLERAGVTYESPQEMYEDLKSNGFQPPMYEVIDCSLSSMAELILNWGNNINHLPPCDGVVLQPNSYLVKDSVIQIPGIANSYEVGLYAIKMGAWGQQVYKTIVKSIELTSNTKSKRPSLIVEPVTSRDGRTITTIPIDHVGRLVDEDIFVGKEVSIRIVSEKDIRLVYDTNLAEYRAKV